MQSHGMLGRVCSVGHLLLTTNTNETIGVHEQMKGNQRAQLVQLIDGPSQDAQSPWQSGVVAQLRANSFLQLVDTQVWHGSDLLLPGTIAHKLYDPSSH